MTNQSHEPHTVMFMSADMVGATAVKDSALGREETAAWPAAFETFFRELPLVLMGQVAMAFSEADRVPEMAGAGHAGDGTYLDYLGPDVDTGFRLIGRGGWEKKETRFSISDT